MTELKTKGFTVPNYHTAYEKSKLTRAEESSARDIFYEELIAMLEKAGIAGIKLDKHGIIVPTEHADLEVKVICKRERVDIEEILADMERKEAERLEAEKKKKKKIAKDKERRSQLVD